MVLGHITGEIEKIIFVKDFVVDTVGREHEQAKKYSDAFVAVMEGMARFHTVEDGCSFVPHIGIEVSVAKAEPRTFNCRCQKAHIFDMESPEFDPFSDDFDLEE
ncbi:hypothetical protein HMPREF2791_04275 [Corynebacterium sp. HMSC034A01]|nr:hypothetical protein HMPREF2791_04275 [Corynebacterium sp. HMSC034A01]